jgi:hypothetical protein
MVLREYQHNFQTDRSCTKFIFSLHQLTKKNREFNIPMFAFVHCNETFDKVVWTKL